jgi:hypothetical protein
MARIDRKNCAVKRSAHGAILSFLFKREGRGGWFAGVSLGWGFLSFRAKPEPPKAVFY